MILAQASDTGSSGNGLSWVFDYLLKFKFPPRAEFVEGLEGLHMLYAFLLVVIGVVYLLYGFRFFKALVIVNGAAVGAMFGAYLGSFQARANMPLLMGGAGAILLGVLARPAIKYAVGLFSAVAGGLAGFAFWHFLANAVNRPELVQHAWAGAIIGIIALGMLSLVALKIAVMLFTGVQGGLMVFCGMCALMLSGQSLSDSIKPELLSNDYLLTILVGVLAAVGFAVQLSADTVKVKKKRKATEKPPV